MKQFMLPEGFKGRKVNGHQFDQDGTLLATDEDAALMALVLVRFHGCTMTDVAEVAAVDPDSEEAVDASLTANNTKA